MHLVSHQDNITFSVHIIFISVSDSERLFSPNSLSVCQTGVAAGESPQKHFNYIWHPWATHNVKLVWLGLDRVCQNLFCDPASPVLCHCIPSLICKKNTSLFSVKNHLEMIKPASEIKCFLHQYLTVNLINSQPFPHYCVHVD